MNANDCRYALAQAAIGGHIHIVRLLFARGANLLKVQEQCEGQTRFRSDACNEAADLGHKQISELLLKHCMNPWNALELVSHTEYDGDQDISEMLLQHTVQLDATRAALCCAQEGNFNMTQYCLEQGAAALDVAAHFNHCPYTWICSSEGIKVLELLVSLGWNMSEHDHHVCSRLRRNYGGCQVICGPCCGSQCT